MMHGSDGDEEKAEILIIRRGHGDDHAAHKGGAWKIAYADFVTAMMAFFLVMWLINSANEATRARVASYFNPIKMTDAQPTERGINDPTQNKKATSSGGTTSGDKNSADANANAKTANQVAEAKATAEKREELLMQNPYKALEALSTVGTGNPAGRMVEVPNEKSGDPFDPKAWEALRQGTQTSEAGDVAKAPPTTQTDPAKGTEAVVNNGRVNAKIDTKSESPGLAAERNAAAQDVGGIKKTQEGTAMSPQQSAALDTPSPTPDSKAQAQAPTPAQAPAQSQVQTQAKQAPSAPLPATDTQQEAMVNAAREKIMQAAAKAGVANNLQISVKMTPEGMLISLSDKTGNSMFEIGSAAPTPPLVALVGAIGTLLESENGKIVVRGHTDARQYHNLKFDNWQLSTARAHMASYMLMRGGLAEDRVFKIEGYGSTSPVNADDPFAAENRRVEFLLKQ